MIKKNLLGLSICSFLLITALCTHAIATGKNSNKPDSPPRAKVRSEINSLNAVLDSARTQSPKANDTVIDRVSAQGSLPVIVRLREANQPYGSFTNKKKPRKKIIRGLQDKVLDDVFSKTGHDETTLRTKRFKMIPAMALQLDPAGMEALLANPNVIDIVEDIAVPPTLQDSVPLIGGDDGSFSGYTGMGQTVAILDTGVDKSHPFLNGKVVYEACYSTTNPGVSASVCPGGVEELEAVDAGLNCDAAVSGCGHGTHVAGIAAGNNATFSGVAQDADIIAIQIFSRFDDAAICGGVTKTPCALTYTSDQIKGLELVYELRDTYTIAAANMSLGGGEYTSFCDDAYQKPIINLLREAGIATVIASGNDGYIDAIGSPGCISSAISVGSTDKADLVSGFSNSADFLSLLAPGSSIESSVPGTGYVFWNGTSMATPHVTGAWAIIKEAKPGVRVSSALNAFQSLGVPITDTRTGAGSRVTSRIDVLNALDYTECANNADCDDGLFCNGAETCANDVCVDGTDPCGGGLCDEAADSCSNGTWIQWDDGIQFNALGFSSGGVMSVASHWLPADIPDGGTITKIQVGVNDAPSSAVVQIWQGSDLESMVEKYSQAFTPGAHQTNEIVLDTPYAIDDSQQMLIGWSATHGASEFPCAFDSATDASEQGNLLFYNGVWQNLNNLGIDGDWLIHAALEGVCLTDDDCIAETPLCSAEATCVECIDDADCPDDSLYCNGVPTCDASVCGDGTVPCAQDQICDEVNDQCVECLSNIDCLEGYECMEGACEEVPNEAPIFLSEPRWVGGWWPVMTIDPANPHKPQSENVLFFSYDDDGLGCQGIAPQKNWMYRPVELQQGEVVPLGDWNIEVPSWSYLWWVLIEEPTIAATTGPGLFEFKLLVTDCLNQTTDSEDFYGKRYYFQVD